MMDTFGACSSFYNEDQNPDDQTVCDEKTDKKDPSFETLTTTDIISAMNEYIENAASVVAVSSFFIESAPYPCFHSIKMVRKFYMVYSR